MLSSYALPSPTVYVELLTKDSVAFKGAEGGDVVMKRDSPLGSQTL